MTTPFLTGLGVFALFGALYWFVARPEGENGRWLWFFMTIGVAALAFIEVVFSLATVFRRLP